MPDLPQPITPTDGMIITQDTALAPGDYFLPNGIEIGADGVTLDGNGARLIGHGQQGAGVRIAGRQGVTVRNLRLFSYRHGIRAEDADGLTLEGNTVRDTEEIPHDTIFLDIWKGPEASYGGGILLVRCTNSRVEDNDLQHQMNGLLTYFCRHLIVRGNVASYNSGYGFHLFGTCDSVFERNWADYCCRFQKRGNESGEALPDKPDFRYGHMGADATGFLIIHASCRNVFRQNLARMGGDGFFLSGRSADGRDVDCSDNLFEENDGSLSPNIAFEATFSSRNTFRNNYADRCNYGFWLAFSQDVVVENNRVVMNRQAGIAAENAHRLRVRDNTFQANGHGLLLWSRRAPEWAEELPEHRTSYEWLIEGNNFTRNGKGIRIAANQDHGIRPAADDQKGGEEARPHDHTIRKNDIQDNRVGIELIGADGTRIEGNILNRNAEADLRQDDTRDTAAVNNLGSAGGYL